MKPAMKPFLLLMLTAFIAKPAAAVEISQVTYKGDANPGQVVITADGELRAEVSQNAADNQAIVEISDATLAAGLDRKQDLSSQPGNLLMISPYAEGGKVRVILQMRQLRPVDLKADGNSLVVSVPWADDSQGTAPPAVSDAEGGGEAPSISQDAPPEAPAPAAPEQRTQAPAAAPSEGRRATDDPLNDLLESQATRTYVGKPITLQLRDADVADVFRLIAEASGFNIILADDVRGRLTLSLVDVPWDLALDTVFQTMKLGGRRNGNVLRVATLANLTAESQEQLRSKLAEEANAPRVTRVFQVSYADPAGLVQILNAFAAAEASVGASLGLASGTGTPSGSMIQVDARTNSVVVQDIAPRLEKMAKLIKILDTQTPQVMIEAKVVEVSEDFSKSIAGNLGLGGDTNNQLLASFAGGNPISPLLSTGVGTPIFADGAAVSQASANGGIFGLSPQVTFLPGVTRLNAVLSMGEQERMLRVVASPRTVVLNKQTATITQSTPVLVPVILNTQNGNAPGVEVQNAELNLTATPTVTNDGSVQMQLTVSRGLPQSLGAGAGSAVAARTMDTQVLVESGTTLVIGGIYTMSTQNTSSGFPVLRKIPIIGALFGSETEATERSELFFFITPRILNEREAGMVD